MRYRKNEIDFDKCRCKEIEVFQYQGNFDNDTPEWITKALNNGELRYDDNGMLYVNYYNLDVKVGYYICLKLPTRGYGDITAFPEEFLNEYYDKI